MSLLPPGSAKAMAKSLRVYHGNKSRHPAMDALHARFVGPGQLAFDIGSHVGDRVSSLRRLGARVVALEPQPACMRVLRLIHGRDPQVRLVNAACGDQPGEVTFRINSANPTVSTVSEDFVKAADGAGGWEGQVWDRTLRVPCTTLDLLIAAHGEPAFIKIDVEGFEDHVLSGLSRPVRALSFEFTTIGRDVAYACLKRLARFGPYGFNLALGETQQLALTEPLDAAAMADYVRALPHEANSGDIYAVLLR